MFCDLVGSTALSTQFDPEDLQDVIRAYQDRCTAIIREYEGFVAKYMGDGILVYFGYPQAHEDDAERAVRAGLEIVDAMSAIEAEQSLQARIGIATGLVSVPNRYMHSPNEMVDLQDLENAARLLAGFARQITPDTDFIPR